MKHSTQRLLHAYIQFKSSSLQTVTLHATCSKNLETCDLFFI